MSCGGGAAARPTTKERKKVAEAAAGPPLRATRLSAMTVAAAAASCVPKVKSIRIQNIACSPTVPSLPPSLPLSPPRSPHSRSAFPPSALPTVPVSHSSVCVCATVHLRARVPPSFPAFPVSLSLSLSLSQSPPFSPLLFIHSIYPSAAAAAQRRQKSLLRQMSIGAGRGPPPRFHASWIGNRINVTLYHFYSARGGC